MLVHDIDTINNPQDKAQIASIVATVQQIFPEITHAEINTDFSSTDCYVVSFYGWNKPLDATDKAFILKQNPSIQIVSVDLELTSKARFKHDVKIGAINVRFRKNNSTRVMDKIPITRHEELLHSRHSDSSISKFSIERHSASSSSRRTRHLHNCDKVKKIMKQRSIGAKLVDWFFNVSEEGVLAKLNEQTLVDDAEEEEEGTVAE